MAEAVAHGFKVNAVFAATGTRYLYCRKNSLTPKVRVSNHMGCYAARPGERSVDVHPGGLTMEQALAALGSPLSVPPEAGLKSSAEAGGELAFALTRVRKLAWQLANRCADAGSPEWRQAVDKAGEELSFMMGESAFRSLFGDFVEKKAVPEEWAQEPSAMAG